MLVVNGCLYVPGRLSCPSCDRPYTRVQKCGLFVILSLCIYCDGNSEFRCPSGPSPCQLKCGCGSKPHILRIDTQIGELTMQRDYIIMCSVKYMDGPISLQPPHHQLPGFACWNLWCLSERLAYHQTFWQQMQREHDSFCHHWEWCSMDDWILLYFPPQLWWTSPAGIQGRCYFATSPTLETHCKMDFGGGKKICL